MTMKWQQRKLKKAKITFMAGGILSKLKIHQIYFVVNFQKDKKMQ